MDLEMHKLTPINLKLSMPYLKQEGFIRNTELKILRTLFQQQILPVINQANSRRYIYQSMNGTKARHKPLEFWSNQQIIHWYFRRSIAHYKRWRQRLESDVRAVINESSFKENYRNNKSYGLTAGKWLDLFNNSYNSVLALIYIGFKSEVFLQSFVSDSEYVYAVCRPGDLIVIDRKKNSYHLDDDSYFIAIT